MVQALQNHDVAIIGMSCQLPCGVNDAYDLWDFCARARCAAGPIPRSRFNAAQFYHPNRSKRGHFNTEAGSFLELDVAVFDAPFFNISEAEAKSLDPQHRLMLQTAFLALENAGIDLASISGRGDVGVFAAGSPSEYQDRSKLDPYTASAYVATSTSMNMFANRISYFLNLKGPSITVDTACSSAITALHLAAESIRRGECSCAIVGGSSLQLSPHTLSFFANLGMLSKDGISFSFDHRANGYGRGEGSVCIVLKALDHAVLDNDCIRALVRGSGVNHVGRSQGITLPDGQSQADLITRVYEQAGLDPNDTTYVEAHGTGTERGDPIEAESIALALKTKSRGPENSIYVGSIKSNFGHLEVVSGLVSIVKCVMMLERSTILPNANFEKANPAVNLHHLNISIPIECIPWPKGLRRASVNNFGFGGSNAHVILEQTPHSLKSLEPCQVQRDIILTTSQMPVSKLFILCAKDRTSLQSYVKPLIEWLSGPSRDDSVLRDMSYTLCCRRTQFSYRFATYASTSAELVERLQGNAHIGRLSSINKAAFIFTGQGAEWPQMGMSLMQYPTFANAFQKAEESLKRLGAEWSLFDEISKPATSSHISDAILSQPTVTALQISLVSLLKHWNIHPFAVCGHSSGEIAAAFAAGFLDLEACMALAYYRGEAASQLSKSTPAGAMMAVGADPAYVESLIACLQDGFATIACYNSPKSVTVSGDRAAILELSSKLDGMGVFHRMLKVNVAYHSDQMISAAKQYLRKIKEVINRSFTPRATSCFYSSVNGKAESSRIVASPWYWATNLVSPVQFSKAVGSLLSDSGPDELLSFIEIGPHSALKGPLRDIVNDHKGVQKNENGPEYFPTLKRNEDACENLLELGASLLNRGFDLNTPAVFSDTSGSSAYNLLPNLPQYRFNTSKRYWHETRLTTEMEQHGSAWNMLLGHRVTGTVGDALEFRNVFSLDDIPWLRDHKVNGETIFPAAGYISMAIEAVRFSTQYEPEQVGGGYSIREMTIGKAFHLPEAEHNEIFTILRPRRSGTRAADSFDWFSFQIHSWRKDDGFSEHCSGLISVTGGRKADEITQLSLQLTREKWIRQLCSRVDDSSQSKISPENLYHQLKRVGLSYGPAFARVSSLRTGDDCAVGTVRCEDTSSCMPLNYETHLKVHPATFDALLHVGLCNLGGNKGSLGGIRAHIPTFLEELFISDNIKQHPGDEIGVYMHDPVTERMSRTTICSLTCFCPGVKDPAVEIRGLRVFDIQEEGRVPSSANIINPLTVDWRDHPDFIGSDCLADWNDPEVGTVSPEAEAKLLDQQAYYLIKWALSVSESRPDQSGHLLLLRKWMDGVVRSIESDENTSETKNWVELRDTEMMNFVDYVACKSFQGQLNSNVGRQLPAILAGQADALNVLFQRDGVWRVYEESLFFSRSNRQLAQLVACLAHQNPSLRILEIGAGTGGLTSKILAILTSTTARGRQYEVYDYTDISTGFFENARSKFDCFEGVNFKRFDVTKDPAGQGFINSYYDLIIAMDVIHAIPSVADGLQNMRKMLKPNGVLALVELNQFRLHLFPFATLPGWWQKDDGPVIEEKEWNKLLLASGYTGVEAAIDDFPGVGLQKVYWTHASQDTNPLLPRIHLIQCAENSLSSRLTKQVCGMLGQRFGQNIHVLTLASGGHEKGIFILLDETADLLLNITGNARFEALKTIFSHADGLIWATRSSSPKIRFVSGFCKALQLENRQLRLAVLHLDGTDYTHSASCIAKLCEHLYWRKSDSQDLELEFREVHGRIQIPRLVSAEMLYDFIESDTSPALVEKQKLFQKDRCLELRIGTVGLFSTLFFQDSNLGSMQLGDDEVLIEIEAIGLNFKDVMVALGSLPWQGLGKEASGIVIATGKRAKLHFPIGSRVLHWGDGLLATHARGDISNVIEMPGYMTFEEAASVLAVYTTAFEALVNLGRLQKDERVLIHAAAGGVGQAAIMIAQWIGAEIFCTVGSLEKKELIMQLYSIPEDHIFSSRSPTFAQGLLTETDMAGVDVILNSLAGEMLRVSWQCIAKLGRFVDISKRDAVANTNLEMAPFDRGVTYIALDLSLYSEKGNQSRKKLINNVLKLFDIKAVRPVYPLNVLPMSDLESGLRTMQTGKHMGKMIIRNDRDTLIKVRTRSSNTTRLRPDASYIITGGAGGLGQFLGQWLLQHGARNIILASRSASTIFETRTMRDMLKMAIDQEGTVLPVPCDVGSMTDVQSMVALAVERGMPPIRGVIHGAMVLKDAMFETTTLEDWQSVIMPKVQGAINLHQALNNEPLDFFICLSSVVGTLGNAGQSSYAGSNSFIDAFCQWRTSQGLPGTSIALPVVSDVGYVAKMAASDSSAFQASYLYDFSITSEQVGHLIKAALNSDNFGSHVVAGISRSPETLRNSRMQDPLLSQVRTTMAQKFAKAGTDVESDVEARATNDPIVDKESLLRATDIEAASRIVYQALAQKIAKDMMLSPQDITLESSLSQIGLDSLVAVEFRNWLAKELDANIRVMEIINSRSVHDLVATVVRKSSFLARIQ